MIGKTIRIPMIPTVMPQMNEKQHAYFYVRAAFLYNCFCESDNMKFLFNPHISHTF